VPSTRHELPLLLLRERPDLLASLVQACFGVTLTGPFVEASASFVEINPAAYAADIVLTSDAATIVGEVQGAIREVKRLRWPLYAASAHAMTGRATWLVVIALDERVARWARKPITTFQGGSFVPVVIGPDQIPRIEDVALARASPELAVLSALAHGHGEAGLPIAIAALAASAVVERRDEDRGKLYVDAVLTAAGDLARAALEAMMKIEGYEPKSEIARGWREEGRKEGREEGLRVAIRQLCAAFGLGWTDERAARIATMDAAGLEAFFTTLSSERRWPD
jgi:hypothetical protein